MKILLINKFYYLCGGSERYLFELTELLEKNGHEVIPFAMQDPQNQPSPYAGYFAAPVNVRKFSLRDVIKTFYNREASKKLRCLIADTKPDIAHVHNIGNHLGLSLLRTLKRCGLPVVMTLHDYKPFCPNRQLYNAGGVCERCRGGQYNNCLRHKCVQGSWAKSFLGMLEGYYFRAKGIYDHVDLFIAPSQFMKDVSASFGLGAEKILVLKNFIDCEKFKPAGKKSQAGNYILYFGRLTKEKGIWTLIEAMAETREPIKLYIAGDGPEYEAVRYHVDSGKLKGRVKLLGPKYGPELEKLLHEAKAVVIPSLWRENMPYSLLEAMAYGQAVIVSDSGGMPELVRDGRNGFIFKTGASGQLAAKIDQLDKYDLSEVGRQARLTVAGQNADSHYRELLARYNVLNGYYKEKRYDERNRRPDIAVQPTA
ncbi:MAG: glycosyltransferase family 4 protein [Planctomycetes bacterium]|nr:glycosyltransferase family 4 protein [Planctomycetota bacterium]